MKFLALTPFLVIVGILTAFVWNLVRFTDCDFQAPYKCEAVHAVGIVPVLAPITVWFATDKETP